VAGFNTTYLRGLGFLQAKQAQEAAAEFERIVAHRGVNPGSVYWPLAHLGLARARALSGNAGEARAAYERFLALWSKADADLPVLREARRERETLGPALPAR
jgi:outer membrane protein assembly factor BamD (BamD/ComL family)